MKHRDVVALALAVTALTGGLAPARAGLEPGRQDIDLGQFKVGQRRECTISIKNLTRADVAIERVAPSCACLSADLDSRIIERGSATSLRITAERQYPGEFSYFIMIIPEDTEKIEPLRINVRGEARSSVSAQVGWRGGILQEVTYPDPIELGVRHQSSACPIVRITTLDGSDLRDSVVDVNSLHLCLDKITPRFSRHAEGKATATACCRQVTIALRPKKALKQGRLRDLLEIALCDGSRAYIPIMCRIAGDVYLDEEVIRLGQLSEATERYLHVIFADKAKRWEAVHWETAGLLGEAMAIRDVSPGRAGCISMILAADRARASQLPKGYLFCRVRFYNDPNDAGVTVFIDGFN